MSQLSLPLKLDDRACFENFYLADDNQHVIHALKTQRDVMFYIFGVTGTGKTHVLQAACLALNNQSFFYLPLKEAQSVADLVYAEGVDVVALDDIDVVLGDSEWEEALFHLYNKALSRGSQLIMSASCAVSELHCKLADLRSRLAWGLSFQLTPLDDVEKLKALQLRAGNRGFVLLDEVGKFLLTHYSRSMSDLFVSLDTLDAASLAAKRKVTVPFVRQVLGGVV